MNEITAKQTTSAMADRRRAPVVLKSRCMVPLVRVQLLRAEHMPAFIKCQHLFGRAIVRTRSRC